MAAKRATGQYLRPEDEDQYWKSLMIAKMDTIRGIIDVADPGSAVNAEDTISVATTRDNDLIIAVAFK